MRYAVVIAVIGTFGALNTATYADTWQTLSNCTWVANRSNDGDSFRVHSGNTNIVVRLNFVDAPETADVYRDRIADQAKYFHITSEQALKVGLDAKAFTESRLESNKFEVTTRWQNAAGGAASHRVYAFVRVDGACLAIGQQWLGARVRRSK